MINDDKIKNDKELENVDGGSTWDPVDENCRECNNGKGCPFPMKKGRYDNCPDCKHFN